MPRVAKAGDVNGDGYGDILFLEERSLAPNDGRIYVVLGGPLWRTVTETSVVAAATARGFVIQSTKPLDYVLEAAAAGDVNEDGLDDLIVGASGADNRLRESSGSAYVIYGTKTPTDIYLGALDAAGGSPIGFRIDGARSWDLLGFDVDGAGDVNGDGRDDVVVASPWVGRSYVIFGDAYGSAIDVGRMELGSTTVGFVIKTPRINKDTRNHYGVAGVGDMNGDGLDDVMVSDIGPAHRYGAFVVYGKSSPDPVDVRRPLRGRGFEIERAMASISAAGDVNRDGLTDALVYGDTPVGSEAFSSYIVFGSEERLGAVDLLSLGDRGIALIGDEGLPGASSLDDVGDFNGDGRGDVLLGADRATVEGKTEAGAAYLAYGGKGLRKVDLASGAYDGYVFTGVAAGDTAGSSVAGVGDVDGDGYDDVIVVAARADVLEPNLISPIGGVAALFWGGGE